MSLNWRQGDYFRLLLEKNAQSYALEMFVDDLHRDKRNTVNAFLAHFGSEDFVWGLVRMLASENSRIAGNAAYIFGTLAEHDLGQVRVLGLINGPHPHRILVDLTEMLDFDDTESVMNAAGTIGTLAESLGGREWILKEPCLDKTLRKVTNLLISDNMWTASNAALVLARLAIAEDGCNRLLNHSHSAKIMTKLIDSLGMDEAGRGMNAAFAIGRLCDSDEGRNRLLCHASSDKMINSLCCMLAGKDSGCAKNACYALSCLAANSDGHRRLMEHRTADLMMQLLSSLLHSEDGETGWFSAMTLRTLAGRRRGVLRLRDHPTIMPELQATQLRIGLHPELKEEVDLTLELLRKLDKPEPPSLKVKGANEIEVSWPAVDLPSGVKVTYRVYCYGTLIYRGTETSHLATKLRANSEFAFTLAVSTEGDDSPQSSEVRATTEESAPDPPESLRILSATTSQLRLGWSPPSFNNGNLKGFVVYNGKQIVETTSEFNCIISGLAPATTYEFFVCGYNHKGKGSKASITASTVELGKHAPGKPSVTVLGRSEMQVSWAPPEYPLGRLHRFEVTMNGKVVYSGTDQNYTARRLTPNTEYVFTVVAVTSEGKCESDPVKKKTLKDEYNVQSTAQRYFAHPVRSAEAEISGKQKEAKSASRSHTRSSSKNESWPKNLRASRSSGNSQSSESAKSRPVSATSSRKTGSSYTRRKSSIQSSASSQEKPTSKQKTAELWPGVLFDQSKQSKDVNQEKMPSKRTVDVMEHHLSEVLQQSPREKENLTSQNIEAAGASATQFYNDHYSKYMNKYKIHRKFIKKEKENVENSKQFGRASSNREVSKDEDKTKFQSVHVTNNDSSQKVLSLDVAGIEASKKAFPTRKNPLLTSDHQKKSIDSFLASVESETLKSLHGRMGRHSKLKNIDSREDGFLEGLSPFQNFQLPGSVPDKSFERNLMNQNETDRKPFTIAADGHLIYQESKSKRNDVTGHEGSSKDAGGRDKHGRMGRGNSPVFPKVVNNEDEKLMASGAYDDFVEWCSHSQNVSDDEDEEEEESAPPSKSSFKAQPANNPLAEPAISFRSALSDHNSFYQRANNFLSSHRPSIKKNLSKLTSAPRDAPYDLGLPAPRGSGANKYNFIPTQFRTQPINMPGPQLQGNNRLAALQDKSAFVKKLEVLSHLSIQNTPACNECGREKSSDCSAVNVPMKTQSPLRYSNKFNTSSVLPITNTKSKSGHSQMLADFAR